MDGKFDFNVKKRLSEWIGRDSQFELLYKLSRDGGAPEKFHELCDDNDPTVTIFYNTDNNVYGGYTSLSWKSEGGWCMDKLSFLFKLYTNKRWEPRKCPLLKTNNYTNVFFSSGSGPWFENLRSFDNFVDKTFGYYSLSTDGLFDGDYYDMGGENAQSVANGHNNVTDLEVYLVKDGPLELDVSWRDPPEWTLKASEELKELITNYMPFEEVDIPEANILLLGQVGAGKSSFLNTINSIFKGRMSSRACTGSTENSLTKSFEKFRVRNPATKTYLKFRICDTRGVEEGFSIKSEDLGFILDGNLPNHYTFNPVEKATPKVPGFIKDPTLKDRMHAVVFVIDGSTFDVLPEGIIKKLKEMKTFVVERGAPQLVFLTKMDKVCKLVEKDISNVYLSEVVQSAVSRVADVIGIPRSHVLPVQNYEKETKLQTNLNILALGALHQALMFADDFLENQYELEN
ncbi:interferon-induced protein 44-like [Ostrea edulis]|uniref:interferon-induced protein 44-like n=1 Tax=Ostrea edulis TaxID=37623 RepID=UPI0024AED12C|nr:interferon-induced protein 44-like [Ostrea edulis]